MKGVDFDDVTFRFNDLSFSEIFYIIYIESEKKERKEFCMGWNLVEDFDTLMAVSEDERNTSWYIELARVTNEIVRVALDEIEVKEHEFIESVKE